MKRYLALLPLLMAPAALAEVKLPQILSSHMVVQRDQPLHIWGWAEPDELVSATLDGKTANGTTDKLGKWSLYLPPHGAGGPFTLTVKGRNTVTLEDVLVGDVWFASGQSNMEMPLKGFPGSATVKNADAEIQSATQPRIRLLLLHRKTSAYPLNDYDSSWTLTTPETAKEFSAVAYFFGREIVQRENVPVGLIDATWGGTPAEAWTSFDGITSDAAFMPLFAAWGSMVDDQADLPLIKAAETREDDAALRAHSPKPKHPWHPDRSSWAPGALYNGMVAPAVQFGIKGVIWYQGEANTDVVRAPLYERVFGTMITDWRRHWNEGNFPFLFVQLANYKGAPDDLWPTVREAQRRTLSLVNTGMAVTIDVGEPGNIHPADKQTVAARLALAARALAYGEKLEYLGPMFRRATVDAANLRVWFDHAEGLAAKGGAPEGFEIAGNDRKYVPATAVIDGESVLVSSPQVPAPKYVRYGWKDAPTVNLCNSAGLPASPFSSEEKLPVTN